MKLSPEDQRLIHNLGSSKFSKEGFLGTDNRPLEGIITDDLRTLEKTGVSKELLVQALKDAYQKARNAFGAEIEIQKDVKAVFHESMGRIPSPFCKDGVFEKGEAVVIDRTNNLSLIITSLGINLIEKHDFFQGRGCRFRIDPLVAIKIFKLLESRKINRDNFILYFL
ncbi:MAG: hypothetical protein DYG83_05885 [Candidatus Brocadia sp. AMX2]|uniref:Uncharacterized protein n=1 Tax=Candidatus Brocadia sinica JPN1 TaxID=1197129 RepID=A0ABQ0JXA9_9BACT|nr:MULTISPECIES: hypothetical protein [Brocadia]MBC6932034.1 hypothetical protein [Candidatus Brocadia sp.]MBL1169487.1 hypothetical protein [Candidatus Brocadia sp. AMX1]MCK6468121.1 hypothetical protein [Candidatus Brocadia sinica]NOG40799.1 hypothetical protein [Planctomycetota bacterium]KAA0242663.1 MAG: hypothetical protein EDM70_13425 [Candidatus Brocadia sp. AMX2]